MANNLVQLNVRIPDTHRKRLSHMAIDGETSIQEIVASMIAELVTKDRLEEAGEAETDG